jgi:hypothetical protein|nr:MAG TPA: Exodeoxyribonuclease 8 [Caudoviricetes sp.]
MRKMKIDIPYYEDNTRISNSAIGWFLKKGPRYLRDMLDGKEEGISGKYLEKGTMIHEYILQPEEFWKDYEILDFEVPRVKQQKDLCEKYYNYKLTDPLESEESILLSAYNFAYNNKKSDEQKLTEAKSIVENYGKYIKYLEIGDKKKIISFSDLTMLKQIKTNLEEHVAANKLLFDVPTTYECHNEFHINWDYKGIPCKSLLDRVMFDHVNKKIVLIDLKTTSDVYNFKHSVEEFDYYRQIAFYICAITWYMLNELNLNVDDYDLEAYIIAIQTNGNNEVRVFNMFNEDELLNRKNVISDALQRISYHINSNDWDHTIEYYTNGGIEQLE